MKMTKKELLSRIRGVEKSGYTILVMPDGFSWPLEDAKSIVKKLQLGQELFYNGYGCWTIERTNNPEKTPKH